MDSFYGVFEVRTAASASRQVYPLKRMRLSDLAVEGESGGKAWFGGLACSGLAGYQAN